MNTQIVTRQAGRDFPLRVLCWNICSGMGKSPLRGRIGGIIEVIQENEPDIVVFIEAGRVSDGRTWMDMVSEIVSETGLTYGSDRWTNATAYSLSKCVLYNREKVWLENVKQVWSDPELPHYPSGDRWGSDMIIVTVCPVDEDRRVVIDKHVEFGVIHAPVPLHERLKYCEFLNSQCKYVQFIVGDFNAFPDWGKQEMMKILRQKYKDVMMEYEHDEPYTFFAFPGDHVYVTPDKLHLLTETGSEIIQDDPNANPPEGKICVRPKSWLDYVFLNKYLVDFGLLKNHRVRVVPTSFEVSDHRPLVIEIP